VSLGRFSADALIATFNLPLGHNKDILCNCRVDFLDRQVRDSVEVCADRSAKMAQNAPPQLIRIFVIWSAKKRAVESDM
jgi:hypothetical protein